MKKNIFLYILFISLIGSLYINYNQWTESQRMNSDLFHEYKYDELNNNVIQTWKSNSKIKSISSDRNKDDIDDKIIQYSIYGKILTNTFDNNFNGEFEELEVYSQEEKLIEKYQDLNEDGFMDIRTEYRKDSIFELKDINLDGFIDFNEIVKRTPNNTYK